MPRREIKADWFVEVDGQLIFSKTLPDGRRPDTCLASGEYEKIRQQLRAEEEELLIIEDVKSVRARKMAFIALEEGKKLFYKEKVEELSDGTVVAKTKSDWYVGVKNGSVVGYAQCRGPRDDWNFRPSSWWLENGYHSVPTLFGGHKGKEVGWAALVEISKELCNPVEDETLEGDFVFMWDGHSYGIRDYVGEKSEFRLNEVFFGDGYGYDVLEETKVSELKWQSLTSDAQLIAKKNGNGKWRLEFMEGHKGSYYEELFDQAGS